MSEDPFERVESLFDAALRLTAEGRDTFLQEACGGDDALRERVERLLRHVERAAAPGVERARAGTAASGEAGTSVVRGDATVLRPDRAEPLRESQEQPGTKIGPYTLRTLIGEGGFGAVYLAEQEAPVRRQVALKVIKLGMDTKEVIARFEAERQALALMDHPNVARVFDAGATDTGRPYFVMEYVPAMSITDHCDRHRLSIRERLGLFVQACEAIQHAHQKGIIHRDIKPSNVLVAVKGDRPLVKVIDFGVAKAISQRLTQKTVFTEQGQLIGTPAYMSPEQAEMSGLDVDTRSDIYSLGVLLYELISGVLPFDAQRLRSAGYDEIRRIIVEEQPPRPSTRWSSLGEATTTIAQRYRCDPRTLLRDLRGDLDWIVMKALEKDRTRRYETANGLAMDIQRHLSHEPVVAGPPSAMYRMSKLIRRHQVVFVAGTAVAAALVLGLSLATWGFISASSERDRALRAEADARAAESEATAINRFLNTDLLAAVAPSTEAGKGRMVLMREVLDEAAKRIEKASSAGGRFEGQPLVEASIRATLGETYLLLGELDLAEPHLLRARELRLRELGAEHPTTLESTSNLANLYWSQGQYDAAEPLYLRTLDARERVLGEEHPDTLRSVNELAIVYSDQARYDEAEPLYLRAIDGRTRVLGEADPMTLRSRTNLAVLRRRQGRLEEAEAIYLKVLDIRKRDLGEEHPDTLVSVSNLASVYWEQKRFDEVEPLYLQTLEIRARVLGEEHPDTLHSMNNLAVLRRDQGRYEDAEALYLQTLDISKRVLGEEHPDTLGTINNLGVLYWEQRRFDDAEPLFLQTLEIRKRVMGEEHPETLTSMGNLALLYSVRRRYDEAEPLYVKTLEIRKRLLGAEHPDTLRSMTNLSMLYMDQGRGEKAEEMALETLEIRKRLRGEEHPDTLASMNNLAILYTEQDRHDDAEAMYLQMLEIQKRVRGEEDAGTQRSMNNLAILYTNLGRFDEAEPLYVQTLEIRRRVRGEDHPLTMRSMVNLAILYGKQERYEEAESLLVDAIERRRRVLGETHTDTRSVISRLARMYRESGHLAEAETLMQRALELRRQQAELPSASAAEKNQCAWELLTSEPASVRDPRAALELAIEANDMTGHEDPTFLDTLSLAYHLTGDTARAIENQRKAIALVPPGDSPARAELEAALAEFVAALQAEEQ